MNILIVDDEWPKMFSGKGMRIINISKRIKNVHNLTFLYLNTYYGEPGDLSELDDYFKRFEYVDINPAHTLPDRIINQIFMKPGEYARFSFKSYYKDAKKKIEEIIDRNKIDIIHNYSFHAAQYICDIDAPKIWDIGDSYSYGIRREGKMNLRALLYARKMYNYECEMISKFDRTLYVSPIDASAYSAYKGRIDIIPNGVDATYFSHTVVRTDYPSVVFTGHMNFAPNIDAVSYFVEKIWPKVKNVVPKAKFYIVGADPVSYISDLNGKNGIEVTGKVDDIRPFLALAGIVVAPMVSGTGIKNKVLEAMSSGKAIVTTKFGVEALNVVPDQEIYVADDAFTFAEKVISLLADESLRDMVGVKARKRILSQYSWEVAISRYMTTYQRVVV